MSINPLTLFLWLIRALELTHFALVDPGPRFVHQTGERGILGRMEDASLINHVGCEILITCHQNAAKRCEDVFTPKCLTMIQGFQRPCKISPKKSMDPRLLLLCEKRQFVGPEPIQVCQKWILYGKRFYFAHKVRETIKKKSVKKCAFLVCLLSCWEGMILDQLSKCMEVETFWPSYMFANAALGHLKTA